VRRPGKECDQCTILIYISHSFFPILSLKVDDKREGRGRARRTSVEVPVIM